MLSSELIEIVDRVVKSKRQIFFDDESVPKMIFDKLLEDEDKLVMIDCETGKTWTAKQMSAAVMKLGLQFAEHGIRKNDAITFYCPNSDMHTIALLSVWSIGAVYAGCLHTSPLRELYNVAVDSGSTYIVACERNVKIAIELLNELKNIKLFVIDSDNTSDSCVSIPFLLKSDFNVKRETFFDLLSKVASNDLLKINFSSGTTGKPKAASSTNKNLLSVSAVSSAGFEIFLPHDIVAVVSHYSHTGGTLTLAAAMLQGCQIAIVGKFESQSFIENIQKYSISSTMTVPSSINLMNKATDKEVDNFCLRKILVTGEVLAPQVASEFIEKFKPLYLGQCFGSTEMGFALVKPIFDGIKLMNTMGVPTDGLKAKIVSMETGEKLDENAIGEIRVTGPQVTDGYLNNEKANKESFDEEGYFKTGDLGYYDTNGYFYFADRFKEIIKYNSLQVSPSELESVLLDHEAVKEAAVIGVPDDIYGSLPKAFVSLKATNSSVSANELVEFVNARVAEFKQLRGGLVIVPEIKKSVLGKVDRKALKTL